MQLPSFSKLIEEFKQKVEEAILNSLNIDEASFQKHNVVFKKIVVKQEEYSGIKLLVSFDCEENPSFSGFEIQCVFSGKKNELLDVDHCFVDLRKGSGSRYEEIYLPEDLQKIETITISLIDPIYDDEELQKGGK